MASENVIPSADSERIDVFSGPLTAHACRLKPGADIVSSIRAASIAASKSTSPSNAMVVLSCVGSVSSLTLRMANASRTATSDATSTITSTPLRTWNEPLEIVSLVGTIAVDTNENSESNISFHLHLSVSDKHGNVYGGHFVNGIVHTTMELILGSIANIHFNRVYDPNTGYRELEIMR